MAGLKALESESLKDLLINSDIVSPDVDRRTHKYKLNDKATKAKILKGAKRCPFQSRSLELCGAAFSQVLGPGQGKNIL